MSLFFEPNSLLNLSAHQLAFTFFKAEESFIQAYFKRIKSNKPSQTLFATFILLEKKYIFNNEVLNKVDDKPIPATLKLKLKYLLRNMDQELNWWLLQNAGYFKHLNQFMDSLRWTSNGKLNVPKTISHIARYSSLNVEDRFELSCKYCCEDEMNRLWVEISGSANKTCDLYKKYWRTRVADFSQEEEDIPIMTAIMALVDKYSCTVLRYMWPKLTPEVKLGICHNSENRLTDDIMEFFLSLPEFQQPELAMKRAFFKLKLLLNELPWQTTNFLSQLNESRPLLTNVHFRYLFDDILAKMEVFPSGVTYEWRAVVKHFFKLYEPLFEVCVEKENLLTFLGLEDKIYFKTLLNHLSKKRKQEFVCSTSYNPLAYLIAKDDHEMLEYLLRLILETDEEVTTFKINFIAKTNESMSLPVLKDGDIKLYSELVSWAALPDPMWQQFKMAVLLNEDTFHIFRDLVYNRGVNSLAEYFRYLFPSEEELEGYKSKVFVKNYAEDIFKYILFDEGTLQFGLVDLPCEPADKFLNFCFPDEIEKKIWKKLFFGANGQVTGVECIFREFYDTLNQLFEYFELTLEDQLVFKRDVLINNGSTSGIINANFMVNRVLRHTDKILEDCFEIEELSLFKRKIFSSNEVAKSFKTLLENFIDSDLLSWEIVEESVRWFNPTKDDIILLKSNFQEIFPDGKNRGNFFKLLDEVK